MSYYNKDRCRREQAGMRAQAARNMRNVNNLLTWDNVSSDQVSDEYIRLLEAKINRSKCKKPRRHI